MLSEIVPPLPPKVSTVAPEVALLIVSVLTVPSTRLNVPGAAPVLTFKVGEPAVPMVELPETRKVPAEEPVPTVIAVPPREGSVGKTEGAGIDARGPRVSTAAVGGAGNGEGTPPCSAIRN